MGAGYTLLVGTAEVVPSIALVTQGQVSTSNTSGHDGLAQHALDGSGVDGITLQALRTGAIVSAADAARHDRPTQRTGPTCQVVAHGAGLADTRRHTNLASLHGG